MRRCKFFGVYVQYTFILRVRFIKEIMNYMQNPTSIFYYLERGKKKKASKACMMLPRIAYTCLFSKVGRGLSGNSRVMEYS